MGQPHKHAAVIKAWADGEEIEGFNGREWVDAPFPAWCVDVKYRVKLNNITVTRHVSYHSAFSATRTLIVDKEKCNIEYTFDPDGKLLDAKVLK